MQPLIECRHVSFLAHSEKKIINHISIIIHPGDFVIILGGNGSGKSSVLEGLEMFQAIVDSMEKAREDRITSQVTD